MGFDKIRSVTSISFLFETNSYQL